jgi:hypothetical protein
MKIPWTILCGCAGIAVGMAVSAMTGWDVRHGWWFIAAGLAIGLIVDFARGRGGSRNSRLP